MKLTRAVLASVSSVVAVDVVAITSGMLKHPLTEANLVHLEEELENAVGKSGGVTQSPLFSELSKMINDTMAPGILTAHTGAQSQLDGFGTAFEACVAPDVSTDSSGATSKGISDKLEEHRQCRDKEGVAASGADECNEHLARQETVQKSACKSVPGSDGSPPALDKDGHVGCKVTAGDYEGWLNSFSHQIAQLKTQYDEAAGGCGNASKLVDDAKPKCLAANSSMAANKTSCDGIQAAADQMGCSNDPTAHAACNTYKTCWETANQTYLEANESIAAAQVNRTAQWRVLKRMLCLLSEEAAGATHDGIDACREQTIDTSHLDLVYPAVPAKVDCSVPAGGPKPCTNEWIQAYALLPASAPAAPCTPCVAPAALTCTDGCCWNEQQHPHMYAAGYAENDRTTYDLEGAKLACLASPTCVAVTCKGKDMEGLSVDCTKRTGASSEESTTVPTTTYIKGHDCKIFECDAPEGKVFLSHFDPAADSARLRRQLEDRDGALGLHIDTGDWQKWLATNKGGHPLPKNVMFFQSHRGAWLQDDEGQLGISTYKGPTPWKSWTIDKRSWTIEPTQMGENSPVTIHNAHWKGFLQAQDSVNDGRPSAGTRPWKSPTADAQKWILTSMEGSTMFTDVCRWRARV